MKNVRWTRPHDTFFAGVTLVPGVEGNLVSEEQLEAMRAVKMFQQCELLGHAIVSDTDAEGQILRDDGPTLKMWLAQGNNELSYPPRGFKPKGVEEYRAEQRAALEQAEKAEADRLAKEEADAKAKADADAKAKADQDAKAAAAAEAGKTTAPGKGAEKPATTHKKA